MGLRTMKRRRREKKTDYKLRLGLLKSGKDRIVIRRSNKYFTIQLVKSAEGQDSVVKSASSRELLKKGWSEEHKGSLKSIPAAYLTGILFAKKVGKGDFVLDLGMSRTLSGSRIFAAVKGLIDGGISLNASEDKFPSEERIKGEHLKEEVKRIVEEVKKKV